MAPADLGSQAGSEQASDLGSPAGSVQASDLGSPAGSALPAVLGPPAVSAPLSGSVGASGSGDDDRDVVARLLGRSPSGAFTVVVRRRDGSPVVIENEPWLADGTPMPTRYWLVDPALRAAVGRLEAAGGVRRAAAEVDPVALAAAHERYRAERDAEVARRRRSPEAERSGAASWPAPRGGVGGTRQGVKCLHAHLAWLLAGGDDPVGRWVATQVPLDGVVPRAVPVLRTTSVSDAPVAAVDCGTNSTRLLVVDGLGTALDRRMRITRLGAGVDVERRLAPDAIERTVAALSEYRQVMDRFGVREGRLVATSAARDAVNAEVLLDRAAAVTGLDVEVLSGDEEGRLSFAGATARLPAGWPRTDRVLVVDIGGGSTELVVGTPSDPDGAVAVSLDVGCVRVTERYLSGDPPSATAVQAARRAVAELVDQARRTLPAVPPGGGMIGLAGTVATVAMLAHRVPVYDRDEVHHRTIDQDHVESWLARLAGESVAARRREPGMVKGRADVIVGGVLVLAEVMRAFGMPRCLASEDDILDGLAASVLARRAAR
jgi:exopolyphosphatase/guanosine-5'-triphosphate,3'-diphosphate pyrophosphatase